MAYDVAPRSHPLDLSPHKLLRVWGRIVLLRRGDELVSLAKC